jgi:hypothetical protein
MLDLINNVNNIAQLLRVNKENTVNSNDASNTANYYRSLLAKVESISTSVQKLDISSVLKDVFPTQSILTAVKPVLPTNKNLPLTPVVPVRNVTDLENPSSKVDERSTGLLDRLSNILNKFSGVKQQVAPEANTINIATPTSTPFESSYIKTESRFEEVQDNIAADVKGIHNLLKKVFGTTPKKGPGDTETVEGAAGVGGGLDGLIGAAAGYGLWRNYRDKIKNATDIGETKAGGEEVKPGETKIPKSGPTTEVPKSTTNLGKAITKTGSVLSKVEGAAGRLATPVAVAMEGYGAYTDIKEQSAEVDAAEKAKQISAEQAKIKKAEIVGETVSKTAVRTTGGLAAAGTGAAMGAGLGAMTGILAPVAVPVLATAGGIAGYYGGQKLVDEFDITKNVGEMGKQFAGSRADKETSEKAITESNATLAKKKEESNAKARALGFKDQEEQVNAIKSGQVKPGETKPTIKEVTKEPTLPSESVKKFEEVPTKTIKFEPAIEESLKEKATPVTDTTKNDAILTSIDTNTGKTNDSIQGLTAGIYKLAEAIARGGKVEPSSINFAPVVQPTVQPPGPVAADYVDSYQSPGDLIRQKAFKAYNS